MSRLTHGKKHNSHGVVAARLRTARDRMRSHIPTAPGAPPSPVTPLPVPPRPWREWVGINSDPHFLFYSRPGVPYVRPF